MSLRVAVTCRRKWRFPYHLHPELKGRPGLSKWLEQTLRALPWAIESLGSVRARSMLENGEVRG